MEKEKIKLPLKEVCNDSCNIAILFMMMFCLISLCLATEGGAYNSICLLINSEVLFCISNFFLWIFLLGVFNFVLMLYTFSVVKVGVSK